MTVRSHQEQLCIRFVLFAEPRRFEKIACQDSQTGRAARLFDVQGQTRQIAALMQKRGDTLVSNCQCALYDWVKQVSFLLQTL
jgi:hypothetical protein